MNSSLAISYQLGSVGAVPRVRFQTSFSNPPVRVRTYEGTTLEKSHVSNGKTLREQLTTPVVKDRVSATISHLPAKIIAKASGSSLKTAENARRGMNAMSLANFLNACRAIPELRALAIELMGIEIESDPDFERGLSMLVNAVQRRSERP